MASTYWARTDNNNANNPALNLTGDPAVEIVFVPSGTNGDLFLDYAGGAIDPDTQVLIGGVTYDFSFELSATFPTEESNGAQQVLTQFEGAVAYIVTIQDYPTAGETTRLSFMPDETATQAEMDAFGNGAISLQNVDTTTTGAVCFASGTHILTPRGEVRVDDLKVGDLVATRDNGSKPIVWISESRHSWPNGPTNDTPILISAGAFGAGAPHRNLIVSPQHKILLAKDDPQTSHDHVEMLAPAKGLTSLPGIRRMNGKREVVYFHILLEFHEILISEGVPSESFFPGPTALSMLRPDQRNEIIRLFPDLRKDRASGYGPQARETMKVSDVKKAVMDVKRNVRKLFPLRDDFDLCATA